MKEEAARVRDEATAVIQAATSVREGAAGREQQQHGSSSDTGNKVCRASTSALLKPTTIVQRT